MAERNRKWTPDETDMACALYLRGLADDRRSAEILSAATGRTYSSAHLKLQNFKAVDPEYTAGGRVGVANGGAEVVRSWKRFEDEGEPRIRKFLEAIYGSASEKDPAKLDFPGNLEPGVDREVAGTERIGQQKLRSMALFFTGHRCCITGNSLPSLLIASHIKPWKDSTPFEKTDIHNVLCLDRDFDGLFDAHRITVTADLEVKFDPALSADIGEDLFEANFARFDHLRSDCISEANMPGREYLALHNEAFEKRCRTKISDL